jgi:Kef-type K+ transport system membrane component KefB/mannitol/fructose-specific phosphotransferase system IIA component (Ntr-type)
MHQELLPFLLGLAALLGVARALGELCRKFGLPSVMGEIIAGLAIGKTVLGRLSPGSFAWLFPAGPAQTLISGYTTVAVVLLLVVAGLEIDLSIVRKSGRGVALTSALGAIVPFILGFGAGQLLPATDLADPSRRDLHAVFLGIALSISALPVIARTLLDLGLLRTEVGLLVISSAVINDLFGWIAFSVLTRQFAAHGASLQSTATSMGLTILFLVGSLVIVRPLADRALAAMQPSPEEDPPMGRVLSLIMVLALLGAAVTQALGMHAMFGGFVMGLAVGDSKRLREHTRHVLQEFVTHVFTPVFFATMALRVDFASAFDLRLILIIVGIACVAKIGGCAVGSRLAGAGWREALAIGFGMNSRGAMEILLASLALEANIISAQIFVALVVMAIVTSLISGPAMRRLLRGPSSPIAELLRAGVVVIDAQAATRDELLGALAQKLATARGLDPALVAAKVREREDLAGTGVGDGVAFPHAEIDGLETPILAFARTRTGLDFDAPDGKPVRLVFLLLNAPREYDRELKLLAAMARLVTREDVRKGLLTAFDAAAAIRVLDDADRSPASIARAVAPASNRA